MSNTYTTITGDTFATVARKVYGSEQYAGQIARSNPGSQEPLLPGSTLVVPPLPGTPVSRPQSAPSDNQNEVAILIDGVRYRFWSNLRWTPALDAFSTAEFSAPFEPDAPGFRETFEPFSFKPVEITVGGVLAFRGTMVGITPRVDAGSRTIDVSAYGVPGVLNDCTPPASAYPIEFNNQRLPDIAQALASPFGVQVVYQSATSGAAFERVAVDPGGTIAAFLGDLARQRGLVMSDTPDGALILQQSVEPGQPVARLAVGASPVISVTPSFSPQQYFSHITGLEMVVVGFIGSQYTVKNPHLTGALRPMTFRSPDVEGGDIQQAVAAKAGRMYGNMAAYSVVVDTWRDPQGDLWAPNTTLTLEAPDAMVYSPYEFVVRSVQFARGGKSETAVLDLVLPGSFSGRTPEVLPWS